MSKACLRTSSCEQNVSGSNGRAFFFPKSYGAFQMMFRCVSHWKKWCKGAAWGVDRCFKDFLRRTQAIKSKRQAPETKEEPMEKTQTIKGFLLSQTKTTQDLQKTDFLLSCLLSCYLAPKEATKNPYSETPQHAPPLPNPFRSLSARRFPLRLESHSSPEPPGARSTAKEGKKKVFS